MQCSVTVVNLIHDTATETDRPVCHVITGCSWREKLDTSGGDPQRTVHVRLPPAAGYLPYFQWAKLPPGEKAAHWTLKRGGKLICGAVRSLTTLTPGQVIEIYRTTTDKLAVKRTEDGTEENIFSLLDEDSDLLELAPGDNLLKATADSGETSLQVTVRFYPMVSGILPEVIS